MGLNSVEERAQNCDCGSCEWWLHKIRPIDRWYLDLVVRHPRCINCINTWVFYCAPFWNQDFLCGALFLHKNDETPETCSLKHNIKKSSFLCSANWTYSSRAGGSLPPPPLPFASAPVISNFTINDKLLAIYFKCFANRKYQTGLGVSETTSNKAHI